MTTRELMHDYIAAAHRGDWDTNARYFAEIRRCNVYRWRGSQIAEIWIFEADQYAVDALFAA